MKGLPKLGLSIGFVLAILVLTYGYLEPRIQARAINDWLLLAICPSSIVLMATDNAGWFVGALADSIVIIANSVWYAFLLLAFRRLTPSLHLK